MILRACEMVRNGNFASLGLENFSTLSSALETLD